MTASTAIVDERKVIRYQVGILAFVVASLVASLAAVQWVASHDEPLLNHRLAEWKQSNGLYRDGRYYGDPEGRLFNEVLPHADYSRGGVYLIGASTAQTEVQLWALPREQQPLIHNYSISATTYTQQFQFVRYLVEQEGLLRAGGDKNCVIIGLFFGDGEHRSTINPNNLFRSFFTRDGLYSYDLERGIQRVSMSATMRQWRVKQNRNRAFWTWAAKAAFGGQFDYLWSMNRRPAAEDRNRWLDRLGQGWEAGMDLEVGQLSQLIDYLQARHVAVQAVYLPLATWATGFPPAERHRERVLAVLSAKAVPLTDLSRVAPDSEFADSTHLGYAGVQRTDPVILGAARACLQRMGLLP